MHNLGLITQGALLLRCTLPRCHSYRMMDIGWKVLIPVALAAILNKAVVGIVRR